MKWHVSMLLAPLSPFGMLLGAVAFVAALTPSMIPRPGVLQGIESGVAFALLYGVGTGASALWSWLEFPAASDRPHNPDVAGRRASESEQAVKRPWLARRTNPSSSRNSTDTWPTWKVCWMTPQTLISNAS